jgi:hypothetical protein
MAKNKGKAKATTPKATTPKKESSLARTALTHRDTKRLWGPAAGLCSYEGCRRKLIERFDDTGEAVVLGEHAHQIPHSALGPRGAVSEEADDEACVRQLDGTGEANYENTILLCGGCHTIIDQAPQAHPVERLKKMKADHEAWVAQQLSQSKGKVLELDTATYQRLVAILPPDGAVHYLRDVNFGFMHESARLNQIKQFLHVCSDPTFEFLTVELETAKTRLRDCIDRLILTIAQECQIAGTTTGWYEVPKDFYGTPNTFFEDTVAALNNDAAESVTAYDDFIRLARRTLA